MSLQNGVDLSESQQMFLGKKANFTQGCVEDGTSMTLCVCVCVCVCVCGVCLFIHVHILKNHSHK